MLLAHLRAGRVEQMVGDRIWMQFNWTARGIVAVLASPQKKNKELPPANGGGGVQTTCALAARARSSELHGRGQKEPCSANPRAGRQVMKLNCNEQAVPRMHQN